MGRYHWDDVLPEANGTHNQGSTPDLSEKLLAPRKVPIHSKKRI